MKEDVLFQDRTAEIVVIPSSMKRVLFVDDDQNVLDGLNRILQGMRDEWQMAFTTSGPEALRMLEESEFDVIVADMRMPGMSGSELLAEVLHRYPNMVRIVLSDTVEHDLALRSATAAHQYLVKPCNAAALRSTLDAALRIRGMLISPKLRTLASRMTSLPALSSVHTRLIQSLDNADISSREVGEIIAQDVGMTAKLLQLANSAFFGLYRYVATPSEAAIYLGVETVRALTLSAGVFSTFQHSGVTERFLAHLQRHSMTTGILANVIAKAENLPKKDCDSSLIGGLLHDVGKLVLAANCPEDYKEVLALAKQEGLPCHEAERQRFGATHADVGAYLLWLWGLPDALCKAVVFHHRPAECSPNTFTAAAAIHVADALEHELESLEPSGLPADLDMDYLTTVGLSDRLSEWRHMRDRILDKGKAA
jgi:HD-like signal output (HDOD) protein